MKFVELYISHNKEILNSYKCAYNALVRRGKPMPKKMQSKPVEEQVSFWVPEDLKMRVDMRVVQERTTLKRLCTMALEEYLERSGDGGGGVKSKAAGRRKASSTGGKPEGKGPQETA